ncbi:hypothetical protein B1987_21685 [Mycobacterium kansasii]|nr:hypothetical protein B1987_21685 [Mycobacterium kansasii]
MLQPGIDLVSTAVCARRARAAEYRTDDPHRADRSRLGTAKRHRRIILLPRVLASIFTRSPHALCSLLLVAMV